VLQPRQHGLGRQQLDPSGREFDREREPVEPRGDLRDRRRVVVRDDEIGFDRDRTLNEQRDGLVLLQRL
jgi:hypothetical protein